MQTPIAQADQTDLQEYLDIMESLFMHPGWKRFVSDIAHNKKLLSDSALSFETEKSWRIAQGRAQAYDQVINHEAFCDTLKSQFLEAQEE